MMEQEQINAFFEKLAYDAVAMKRAEKAQETGDEELAKEAAGAVRKGLQSIQDVVTGAGKAVADNPGTAAGIGLGAAGTAAGGYGAYKGNQATNRQEQVVGPALGQLYGQAAQSQAYDQAHSGAIEQIVNRKEQLQQQLEQLDQQQDQIEGQVGMGDEGQSQDQDQGQFGQSEESEDSEEEDSE